MRKLTHALTLIWLASPALADLDCKFSMVCLPGEPCKDSDLVLTITGSKSAPMIKGPIFDAYPATTVEKSDYSLLLTTPDEMSWEVITLGPAGDAQLTVAAAPDMALPFSYRGTCSGELK